MRGLDILVIVIELKAQRRCFLGGQPLGVFRFILKIEVGGKTQDRCRQALGNERLVPVANLIRLVVDRESGNAVV
jgi:hypothetical protein